MSDKKTQMAQKARCNHQEGRGERERERERGRERERERERERQRERQRKNLPNHKLKAWRDRGCYSANVTPKKGNHNDSNNSLNRNMPPFIRFRCHRLLPASRRTLAHSRWLLAMAMKSGVWALTSLRFTSAPDWTRAPRQSGWPAVNGVVGNIQASTEGRLDCQLSGDHRCRLGYKHIFLVGINIIAIDWNHCW